MNWEDERYVRLYTRDTITWKLLGWEGRCLLPLLLRKVDRSGCIELQGAGAEGISALVDVPLEVVTPGLAKLIERGTVEIRDDILVFPKYMAAHEARQSDKLRAQESRAKRRDSAVNGIERPAAQTWVYFVQASADQTIKIGYAADVQSRVSNIANGRHDSVRLLATVPGGPVLERELHARFAAHRIGSSEWFNPAQQLLEYLADLTGNVTARDETSRDVTPRHTASHDVTLRVCTQRTNSENQRTREPENHARTLSQEQDPQPSAPAYDPASDDNAAAAWLAIERGAGGPEGVGLKRNYGQAQPLWLDDNRAMLWCRNWGELRKARPAPTLADAEKLGRWLAAGGAGDIKTPWQLLAKGGAAPNIGAWLDQADRWDGISDPWPQRAAPRAPQRPDAVTTSKTKEVRVTNNREGLRLLGIEVSDRVIHGENAGSPSDPGDASGF